MFGWLKNARSDSKQRRTLRLMHVPMRVRGRYDAAATTDENRRHWANADLLSANAANSPQVRKTLRSRARYEVANNSYARGIVSTLANDCIGTGPRLQMLSERQRGQPAGRAGVYADGPMPSVCPKNSAPCGWPGPNRARRSPCWWPIRRWIRQ